MAYADQQMSGNRIIAIIIVALIHIAVGYALVTGLAYSATKKLIERVTTVDIEEPEPEPEPEEEPPPPQPETAPPPPVAPPPPINIAVAPPPIQVQQVIPPPAPVARVVPPPAPPAPPPAPPPPQRANPVPKGRPQSWVSNNDYPSRAIRDEMEGAVGFTVTVGPDGRVANCTVGRSSGHQILDDEVCRLITRRARFDPKLDSEGRPTTGTWSSTFRWELPR